MMRTRTASTRQAAPVPPSDSRPRSVLFDWVLWIALAALMLALSACEANDVASAEAAPEASLMAETADHGGMIHGGMNHGGMNHRPMEHQDLAAGEPTDFSIYNLESTWYDQTGAERSLQSLRGRVQVVAMLYTSCAYACPRTMLDMKRIEGELGSELNDDVGFVVVSIDPERDTAERLAEFASGSRLDPERWTLLAADEGDILELAALLGVDYRETSPGEWVHSNLITVLDRDGEIVHRQLGLGTDPAETLRVIREISR